MSTYYVPGPLCVTLLVLVTTAAFSWLLQHLSTQYVLRKGHDDGASPSQARDGQKHLLDVPAARVTWSDASWASRLL